VTRFLDPKKLAKARKQSLEVGTVEAAGHSATLVATIRKGVVIGLAVQRCADCGAARTKRIDKKTLLAIRDSVADLRGGPPFRLPALARNTARESGDIFIPIWPWPPIVIIFEPGTFCIAIRVGTTFCVWCPGTDGFCLE
jgi:hypothetical protein